MFRASLRRDGRYETLGKTGAAASHRAQALVRPYAMPDFELPIQSLNEPTRNDALQLRKLGIYRMRRRIIGNAGLELLVGKRRNDHRGARGRREHDYEGQL